MVALAFWLFATLTVASAVMVISARNTVHSVLFLIFCFFNAAGLFVLLGAEFLAMIMVVVYVGAVAVLFLFVVMMLDIDFAALRQGFMRYLWFGLVVGAVLLVEVVFVFKTWISNPDMASVAAAVTPPADQIGNTQALGSLIYTHYVYAFQASGLILLVAMIGAIMLTHRAREGVRKQKISDQIARKREDAVAVVKVPTGEGV